MLRFSVEGADQIGERVWHAELHPSEVLKLGQCSNTYGRISVILVTTECRGTDGKLEFGPDSAHVLNIGASSEAVFILDPTPETGTIASEEAPRPIVQGPGDQAFLRELHQLALLGDIPDELRVLGEELLAGVRRESPGELEYHPKSGKYVESQDKDNFWTVKIQTKAKSLRLTVRGDPEWFRAPTGIELKPDMRGYSRFLISRSDQLEGALSIIRQAKRKNGNRRRSGG